MSIDSAIFFFSCDDIIDNAEVDFFLSFSFFHELLYLLYRECY